ncbi:transposase [Zavarzinella formosa]|uniref:transposase n=1 Tax=Zavarzinella formosa TaxID=360055 RepID=UPI00031200F4|nr:transposase [Zavarzinella formosa]
MVIGFHVIFGAYGFWLPNDPRGSWSEFVGSYELFRHGKATKTTEIRSVAYREHDRPARLAAKRSLQRPPVHFTGVQAQAIGQGVAAYVKSSGLMVWGCAILPDHVHLVVEAHHIKIEQIVIQLKGRATTALIDAGIHPFAGTADKARPPKCFARGEWAPFLETPEDVERAIQYVEDNPVKEGKPRQHWSFVKPFSPT